MSELIAAIDELETLIVNFQDLADHKTHARKETPCDHDDCQKSVAQILRIRSVIAELSRLHSENERLLREKAELAHDRDYFKRMFGIADQCAHEREAQILKQCGELSKLRAVVGSASSGIEPPTTYYGIIDPKYAAAFTEIRLTAWSYGWAIAMHGSFTRDLDLIAVPWTDTACEPEKLVKQILWRTKMRDAHGKFFSKPHGRLVWTLMFQELECPRFIDLSVFPLSRLREA